MIKQQIDEPPKMTLEKGNRSVEEVQSVRDRSLVEAYDVHDVGYEIITRRLKRHGFYVVDHGDDARHADEILYGDGPDLAVYANADGGGTPIDLLGYIEIKTKESETWFGRCNRRHFNEYVNFSKEVDVPVFIWFALVNSEENTCLRDGFFKVEDTDQIDGQVVEEGTQLVFDEDDMEYVTTSDDGRSIVSINHNDIINTERGDQIERTIPEVHGNQVVCLDENQIRSTAYILNQLKS